MGKTSKMNPDRLKSSETATRTCRNGNYGCYLTCSITAIFVCNSLLHVHLLSSSQVMALLDLRKINQRYINPKLTTKA